MSLLHKITYKLLRGPTEASLSERTGLFEWKVPEVASIGSKIPVQVSAQEDATHNLMSTYEILFEIQPKSDARTSMASVLLLLFALASGIMF